MARKYTKDLDAALKVRLRSDQKAAVEAIAKARGETAGALVRAALDQYVVKSGTPLTPEVREAVVAKAAPAVEAALEERDVVLAAVAALGERLDSLEKARDI